MSAPMGPAGAGQRPGGRGGRGGRVQPAELSARVRSSLGWSLASQIVVRVLTVGSTVVLLHLVTPGEYGVYIYSLAVVTVVMAFNDVGQAVAVARWPGPGIEAAGRCCTTIAWAASAASFAACTATAAALARLGGTPTATGVVRLLAVLVLIDGLTAVPRALLLRSFRHRVVALGDLAGVLVNIAVALSLALAGAKAWAPAVGTVVAATVTAGVVLLAAPAIPRPGWDRRVARQALGFGLPVAAALLVELLLLNVDYVVVGNQLGASALGLYAVAFNVASWPVTLFTQGIRRVSVAAFANLLDNHGDLGAALARSGSVLATVLLPVCVGLAVLAEPLLRILYGARFAHVAGVLSWLVVLAGARVATGLVVDVLLSQGRSGAIVRLQVLWLLAAVPALIAGAQLGGLTGVAAAHALVGLVLALPLHFVAVRHLGVNSPALRRALVRPLAAAAAALAVGATAASIVHGPWLEAAAAGTALTATYVVGAIRPSRLRAAFTLRGANAASGR
ncbi:MAG: oligosaccharide flippase family protein [Acidimicrobiia bacterium]|nr:oligosaccharide flippase family protein [Acidimicrobiia bacterium]